MAKKMEELKLEQAKKIKFTITYGNRHKLVPDPQKVIQLYFLNNSSLYFHRSLTDYSFNLNTDKNLINYFRLDLMQLRKTSMNGLHL